MSRRWKTTAACRNVSRATSRLFGALPESTTSSICPSQAIEAYQKAIELDPDYYAGYHGLGVLYYYLGNYPEAARQFQKSIERAPGLFDEYTNLGAVLDELGQDTEAEKALLTSLKLRETPEALNNMGAIRAYQKKDVEAIAYYKRAVALDPSNYIYLENLADSNRRLGRVRDANAAYRQAMDLATGDAQGKPPPGISSRVCCLHRSPARRPEESGRRNCAGSAIVTPRDQGHSPRCTDLRSARPARPGHPGP